MQPFHSGDIMTYAKTIHIRLSRCEGFTLTELIVAMGMVGVIITTLFLALSTTQDTVNRTTRNSDIVDTACRTFDLLEGDLAAAIPPRTDHSEVEEPGYVFIIRNHGIGGDEDDFDELWLSTTNTLSVESILSVKNVRYFVDWDDDVKRYVLKRQLFSATDDENPMHADTSSIPLADDDNSTVLCGAVEKFEVQYLSVLRHPQPQMMDCIPDKFMPEFDEETGTAGEINFRDSAIWFSGQTSHSDLESSPRAIRVFLVLRDYSGGDPYYFERVFRVANTLIPGSKWLSEEEEDEEE